MNHTLPFASDYMEGCHPNILRRLSETNHQPSAGYGHRDDQRAAHPNECSGHAHPATYKRQCP